MVHHVKMKVLTVAHICLFDASIVCNVLALVLLPLKVKSCLLIKVVAVLVHYALGPSDKLFRCCLFPPVSQVPTLIVEST